jgi:hypothetical protein
VNFILECKKVNSYLGRKTIKVLCVKFGEEKNAFIIYLNCRKNCKIFEGKRRVDRREAKVSFLKGRKETCYSYLVNSINQ